MRKNVRPEKRRENQRRAQSFPEQLRHTARQFDQTGVAPLQSRGIPQRPTPRGMSRIGRLDCAPGQWEADLSEQQLVWQSALQSFPSDQPFVTAPNVRRIHVISTY